MIIGVKGDSLWAELVGPKGVSLLISSVGDRPFYRSFVNLKIRLLVGVL